MVDTERVHYAQITEEMLEHLRRQIGVPIKRPQPHIEVATKDAIRHWAHGMGDTNPLWTDEEYAKKTRWGGIIAPPTILYAFDKLASGQVRGMPGVHGLFGGTTFEWFLPIRLNDRLVGTSYLKDLIQKSSQYAGRSFVQIYETIFRNQNNELVAKAQSHVLRLERDAGRERGKYAALTQHHYTPEELRAIEADYDREEIRGPIPRYWEDVQVGEEPTPVVKGPLTVRDCIAFSIGWGSLFVKAHRIALEFHRQHPAGMVPNELGIPDAPERVHWDNAFAQRVGAPAAFDYGPQRVAWIGHMLTNWMGDDGLLRKLHMLITRLNLIGDTTWCKGRVSKKYTEEGQRLVDCEVWCQDQRGEVTSRGTATIILPSKGA